ncbi:hypothetical protein CDEST_05316 [Colletotrichum destructivum]|uniref:Uncharacterized protein n=1 Tax=Colletotrichum destructivum TaxID=34406 RepID=A0AAX4IAA2_9PEZI|nr:hypothetical protein CDEST_05316 [Colletotrichum destructivum]
MKSVLLKKTKKTNTSFFFLFFFLLFCFADTTDSRSGKNDIELRGMLLNRPWLIPTSRNRQARWLWLMGPGPAGHGRRHRPAPISPGPRSPQSPAVPTSSLGSSVIDTHETTASARNVGLPGRTRLTNRSVGCAHKRTCIPTCNAHARKHRERGRECERVRVYVCVCEHRLRREPQKPVADIPPIPGRPNFGLAPLYGYMRYITDRNSWLALGSVEAERATWTIFRVCLLSFGFKTARNVIPHQSQELRRRSLSQSLPLPPSEVNLDFVCKCK